MEKKTIDPTAIPGWGMDNDLLDNPNYPIKHYTGDDHQRKNWLRPSLQPASVEILKSTERPFLSAVFGTTVPPSGLSGALRRLAFKRSENMYRHWIPLLLADRINVIEGVLSDLLHGRLHFFAERGWRAIGRYKPGLLAGKIITRLIILAAIAAFIIYKVQHHHACTSCKDHETSLTLNK